MRIKQTVAVFLLIAILTGCSRELPPVTDGGSEDDIDMNNEITVDRSTLVSEYNRVWFDDDGTIRYYGDFSEMDAPERQAVVVPEEILALMTTEELFDMVFDWSYGITSPYIYNFPSYYIDYIYDWFNAMPELLERDDLGDLLITKYHSMEYMAPSDSDTEEQLRERDKMAMIEILLALDSVYDDLDDSERTDIVNELYAKSKNRTTRTDYSGFFLLLQQKDWEENSGLSVYDSEGNPEQDYYNKDWNWCTFINENCSEDIRGMLKNRMY